MDFSLPASVAAEAPKSAAFAVRRSDSGAGTADSSTAVLSQFSLSVARGEFLSIVGPSGCGKSTLLKLMAGLVQPRSGVVDRQRKPGQSEDRIGFVFQHPTLLPWRTALGNLQLPHELGNRRTRKPLTAAESAELLLQVGLLPADSTKRPSELSGGMQMRLSLARALATRPDVLLLDEPFAAVDDLLRMKLQEDVRRLHEERQLTSVLVTHNLQEAVFLSDRVIVLSGAPARVLAIVTVSLPGQSLSGSRTAEFRESPECLASLRKVSSALFSADSNAGTLV